VSALWTIVVAAGSGTRFGKPKQYEPLGDQRVLDWSLQAARQVSDGVVLVVPADRVDRAEPDADVVVAGADTRSRSVRAGLAAVPEDADVVVVHDGARPLASPQLFTAVADAVRHPLNDPCDGVIPVVAVTDTVRSRTNGVIDRSDLVVVQTPQAFAATALRAAHAEEAEGTDDASLVEAQGGRIELVPGDPVNLKITYPSDLRVAAALLP